MAEETAKRTKVLSVRLSPAEWFALRERAKLCGQPVSRYAREVALGSVPRARPRQIEQQAIYQLARIGNNLNQLARAANASRRVELSRRLESVLAQLVAALEKLA